MVISNAPFSKLESVFVASSDRQRALRVLSSPAAYQLNVSVYRKLYQIKNYHELPYDQACDAYNKFLDETNGHPVYAAHPYLAAFRMFEQLPIAEGIKGAFTVDYQPKRTQVIKYLNKFGQEECVKVPQFFKGYTYKIGPAKPIPNYKNGVLDISLKSALSHVRRYLRNEYEDEQAYRDEIMQVGYKPLEVPQRQQSKRVAHFDFMCARNGNGCEVSVTVDNVPPSKQSVAKAYEGNTASSFSRTERPSKHKTVVGQTHKPSWILEQRTGPYVRSVKKGKVKIVSSESAQGPFQPFLTNFYLPYRSSGLKVPSV